MRKWKVYFRLFLSLSLTRDSFQLMNSLSRLYFNEHQMIRCIRWFRTHFRTHAIDLSSRVHKYLTMRCHSNFWTFFTREIKRENIAVFTHRIVSDYQTQRWYPNDWFRKSPTFSLAPASFFTSLCQRIRQPYLHTPVQPNDKFNRL